ncbi:MAG: DNA mismatch repair endonuclease MutL [Dehalococcoidia bacterium]|nr:DNA mismatch repair endonuclease MutL [Dehalococcoidia bacterium]
MTHVQAPPIRVLPPQVAARIAAGEVIERPVSVVRELMDNAIDAGSARVTIETEDGGVTLIRVTDDGRGIPPGDLELAFERHATSKIEDLSGLGHVRTLGFRGEALPSIAAAADVEVLSRSAGEPVGVQVTLVGARAVRRSARAAPVGTAFTVRELFGQLPARRKFLGSTAAESRAITTLVSHYALAYPQIAFQLVSGGRRVISTAGDGDLRHAFAAVHGAATAAAMLAVDHVEAAIRVSGLAGPPGVHRGNRAAISVFINGRWVQSRPLVFAIVDAYEGQLPIGRHPVAALHVRLDDEDVDVNVHPAKAEVRLRDERGVARAVRHSVMAALEGARPVSWLDPGPPNGTHEGVGLPAPSLAPSPALRARLEPPLVSALRGPQPVQARMDWSQGTPPATRSAHREVLPLLRVVGQVGLTYIIAEGPDGMYLIDQHAAHERVVYDRIVAQRAAAGAPATQPLLEPELLELDALQAATAAEFADHLAGLGLGLEPFGERGYLVRAVPAGVGGTGVVSALRSLLDQLAGERRVADPFARAAATVACHGSVRAGTAMALEEMRALIEDLARTGSPRTCPHGRPTLVHVGADAIERQFGRR